MGAWPGPARGAAGSSAPETVSSSHGSSAGPDRLPQAACRPQHSRAVRCNAVTGRARRASASSSFQVVGWTVSSASGGGGLPLRRASARRSPWPRAAARGGRAAAVPHRCCIPLPVNFSSSAAPLGRRPFCHLTAARFRGTHQRSERYLRDTLEFDQRIFLEQTQQERKQTQ